MEKLNTNILGVCKSRWINKGDMTIDGHNHICKQKKKMKEDKD